MTEDLKKARNIYWEHACNHFHIDREGMSERYKAYGGAPRYEAEWRREYIRMNVDLAKVNVLKGMRKLASAYAHEALLEVIRFENYHDDFERFWYAFYLKDLAECEKISIELKQAALKKSRDLWMEITRSPKGIKAENRTKIDKWTLDNFGASSAEEYLSNYSRKMLERV